MVRQRDVVEREERIVLRQGLRGENVESGSHEPAVAEAFVGRGAVDEVWPRRIDEIRALFHREKIAAAEDERLRPRVQGDDVGLGEQLRQCGVFAAVTFQVRIVRRHEGVADENPAIEGRQLLRHAPSDVAEPDDADSPARDLVDLAGVVEPLLPFSPHQAGMGSRDIPRLRQHEPQRELGHRVGVVRRIVQHGNSPPRRRLDIDVFEAAAVGQDYSQAPGPLDHPGVDGAEMAHDRLGALDARVELLGKLRGVGALDFDPARGVAHAAPLRQAEERYRLEAEIGKGAEAASVIALRKERVRDGYGIHDVARSLI